MDKRTTGVYNKFLVYRTDGKDAPGGKHDGCVYFVLDATHDPHAKPALVAYADSCESAFPALATDVRNMATLPPVELPARPSRPVEAAIDSLSDLLCDEDLSEAIDAEMLRPVEATPMFSLIEMQAKRDLPMALQFVRQYSDEVWRLCQLGHLNSRSKLADITLDALAFLEDLSDKGAVAAPPADTRPRYDEARNWTEDKGHENGKPNE